MDETDLIKLPILGRYKEYAVNEEKKQKKVGSNTVKVIHYHFKNILILMYAHIGQDTC